MRVCSVTDALDVIGDRYSLPIVREVLYGNGRFTQLAGLLGAPRALLAQRLRKLEANGVVARHRYSQRPPRDEYRLTPAGRELLPVLIALREWGERHCEMKSPSLRVRFSHRCGHRLNTEPVCTHCHEVVRFEDLQVVGPLRPGAAKTKRS
jgi:DNA-binding HxlR family transcriptional regulator